MSNGASGFGPGAVKVDAALEQLAVNTIRGLAIDGVQKANSGHPGMPMGMADAAYVLWTEFLRHDPKDPEWHDRDRFILSAGHGSMLLYSLLHLFGYPMPMDQLKQFRQYRSLTPGHPEVDHALGIETSTGPLGQGFGNGVGMAIAERMLAERFGDVVEHRVYAIVSDGDCMEGVSAEAASLAGHLGLGKLTYIYDYNHISIEGSTDLAYSDDPVGRFEAYHWHVQDIDGHDRNAIREALAAAQKEEDRPSMIVAHTKIGKGSPNLEGDAGSHGAPLGDEEVAATKKNLGISLEAFHVPDEVREFLNARTEQLHELAEERKTAFASWRSANAEKADEWDAYMERRVPADLVDKLPVFEKAVATRSASGTTLQSIAPHVPHLVGGSADLSPSTITILKDYDDIAPGKYAGRNFHFGVREHGMGAIMNGMALHGGFTPYGATFLVFSDYMRGSIRVASIMKQHVIYVFTHDSIFVGEDGPTHQPVEQVAALRIIPGVTVIRPADPTETAMAWVVALEHKEGPVALILSRQGIPVIDRDKYAPVEGVRKGGYVLSPADTDTPDIVLIGTGSEVELALGAQKILADAGKSASVVSLPSWELFDQQPQEYRDSVLPPAVKCRLAVEAGISAGWTKYIGDEGGFVGQDNFGMSAPYQLLAEKWGYTAENVAERAKELIGG
jgi:transketolase